MLVECGLTRVTHSDGEEQDLSWAFRPSLARIAALASPEGVVELFARLHGDAEEAAESAAAVLTGLADESEHDLGILLGYPEPINGVGVRHIGGVMPADERVILARHLMHHGMVGPARPDSQKKAEQGSYCARFDAGEYIAAARVHLGMTLEEAGALSMTEFAQLFEIKFPDSKAGPVSVPTREEYEAGMRAFEELKARRAAGQADHG